MIECIKTRLDRPVTITDTAEYTGALMVEPAFREQVLQTDGKVMPGNVRIRGIRVTEVPNTHGTGIRIG